MSYTPGTHIIASLHSSNAGLLILHDQFKVLIDDLIDRYQLQKLGEVYHQFTSGGFTAVVCLSESHISIHTWPEHQLINLDIYLSNYQRNNDGTVDGIYLAFKNYFKGTVTTEQILIR